MKWIRRLLRRLLGFALAHLAGQVAERWQVILRRQAKWAQRYENQCAKREAQNEPRHTDLARTEDNGEFGSHNLGS
jgi:hypothetical protein